MPLQKETKVQCTESRNEIRGSSTGNKKEEQSDLNGGNDVCVCVGLTHPTQAPTVGSRLQPSNMTPGFTLTEC